jgi:hypothetical protein
MTYKINIRFFVLIFAIGLSACSPTRKFKETAKVWEPEITKLEILNKAEKKPENAILFIGSSSIRLWKNIEADMYPYSVIQRGFGGAKFTDLLVYTKRLVYPHKFGAVVIFVANDITGEKDDKTPREVLGLFKSTEKTIRKKFKNQPIYFIGITPNKLRWKVWPLAREANQLIESYCKTKKNLHFIATEAAFIGPDGLPIDNYFLGDKLHLTQNGYDVWAKIIKEKLDKTLK